MPYWYRVACPNQDSLIAAAKNDTSPQVVKAAIEDVRRAAGPDSVEKTMLEYGLDAIVAPTESAICTIASFSGKELKISGAKRILTWINCRVPNWDYAAWISVS